MSLALQINLFLYESYTHNLDIVDYLFHQSLSLKTPHNGTTTEMQLLLWGDFWTLGCGSRVLEYSFKIIHPRIQFDLCMMDVVAMFTLRHDRAITVYSRYYIATFIDCSWDIGDILCTDCWWQYIWTRIFSPKIRQQFLSTCMHNLHIAHTFQNQSLYRCTWLRGAEGDHNAWQLL